MQQKQINAKSHVKSNINKKKGYSQNSFSIWKKIKPKVTEEKGDGDKNAASLSSDMKSNAMRNSYTYRLDHLISKMTDSPDSPDSLDGRATTLSIILLNRDNKLSEVFTFKFNFSDELLVEDIIKKIPLYASDALLAKHVYCCLCHQDGFILKKSAPLRMYYFPPRENQFIIAVSDGVTCSQSVKLAQPIIENIRYLREKCVKSFNDEKITNDRNKSILPFLRKAARRNSMEGSTNRDPAPVNICIPDAVYMVMGLIFLCIMQVGLKKDTQQS